MLEALRSFPDMYKQVKRENKKLLQENKDLRRQYESLYADYQYTVAFQDDATASIDELNALLRHERMVNSSLTKNMDKLKEENKKSVSALKHQLSALKKQYEETVDIASNTDYAALSKNGDDAPLSSWLSDQLNEKDRVIEELNSKLLKANSNIGSKYVETSVLEDGIKTYTGETSVDEAHDLFMRLNEMLIGIPSWTKNAKSLKEFFVEYNKRSKMQNVNVGGDYVVNKNVENEANGVGPNATGININKNE